jgi:hypothetical protein
MGKRGIRKERKPQRKMDESKSSMSNHGLTKENAGDRNVWRNLVWMKENHCTLEKFLKE